MFPKKTIQALKEAKQMGVSRKGVKVSRKSGIRELALRTESAKQERGRQISSMVDPTWLPFWGIIK